MSQTHVADPISRPLGISVDPVPVPSAVALLSALAILRLLIQFLGISHYGFFRDELYYMACGEHPAWGYVDQPPLIALLAWLVRHTLGDSLVALRLLPALAGAAVVLLTGLLARELGGGRVAQALAATAILFAPAFLAFDSFFSMNAFEPLFWLLCAWLAVRVVNGSSPKLWLLFGVAAGLGLENKHPMLLFGFALTVALLVSGHARMFHSKWIWIGAAIALAIFVPNLIWEARHGWPQIEVVRNAQQFKNVPIGPLQFLWENALFLDPIVFPVWACGLARLLLAGEAKSFRFLGWTYLMVMVVFIAFGGKSYYALPLYPVLMAAGGVAVESLSSAPARRWLRPALAFLVVIAGIATLPFGVPLLPVETFLRYSQALPVAKAVKTERDANVALPQLYADMFGWEALAQGVARVYHDLPAAEQADCAILAGNYGQAGAIDYYGPRLGLPKVLSGHNSYFYWGPRGYSGACVIILGERADEFKNLFGDAQLAATVVNPHGMPLEQHVPIYVCRKPSAPLAVLWPRFKLII